MCRALLIVCCWLVDVSCVFVVVVVYVSIARFSWFVVFGGCVNVGAHCVLVVVY